jgi:hypothetical protein
VGHPPSSRTRNYGGTPPGLQILVPAALAPDNLFAVRAINGFDYGYEDTKDPNRHLVIINPRIEPAAFDISGASVMSVFCCPLKGGYQISVICVKIYTCKACIY